MATVCFTVGDVTLINDPCFDAGGGWYHHGWGGVSKKTKDPRLAPEELSNTPEGALVTHGHHYDNLDDSGRAFLESVPDVVSTPYSAEGLDAPGLEPGERTTISTGDTTVSVRAVPARHGLGPLAWLTGPVNGYLLEYGSEPLRIYVSGDTVFTENIAREAGRNGPIDLFFPHLGSAYFPYLSGPLRYTMAADDLLGFLEVLEPTYTYPIHNEGWSHFRPVEVSSIPELERHTTLRQDPECRIDFS